MGLEVYDEVCKVKAENLVSYLESIEPVLNEVSEDISILENPPYFNTGEIRQIKIVKDIETELPKTHRINEALGVMARNNILRLEEEGFFPNSDICQEFHMYQYTEERMDTLNQFIEERIDKSGGAASQHARETNFTVDLTGFDVNDYI